MLAYKKYVTIKDPAKLELTGLPFRSGQWVEIVMIAEEEGRDERIEALRAFFKKTRPLPQAEAISEDVIAEEIEEYRAGIPGTPY